MTKNPNLKLPSEAGVMTMKNLKVIALAAIVASTLFACDKSSSSNSGSAATAAGGASAARIVYVNTDTLLSKYEYYKAVMKDIEAKSFKLDNELKSKSTTFQNKVALFQQQVQAGGVSQDVAQTRQAQLQKEQQDIVSYRDFEAQALSKEQGQKTEEVLNKIQAFLKVYAKEKGFQMCLGYQKGGAVLFADESLDVTKAVLEGLNKEYSSNKPAETKAEEPAKK